MNSSSPCRCSILGNMSPHATPTSPHHTHIVLDSEYIDVARDQSCMQSLNQKSDVVVLWFPNILV